MQSISVDIVQLKMISDLLAIDDDLAENLSEQIKDKLVTAGSS